MHNQHWFKTFLVVTIASFFTLTFGSSPEKTVVPVFLFSGQSNMVCLGASVRDLPSAEQNMTFENIKIHNRSDNAKSGWETLKPGFGADANHFGVELYFGKALAEAMPETKMAFIKDATSGTYLGQSGGWLPPSSGGPGTLYRNMMDHIDKAMDKFNDAFDTSLYTPRWAGFIWHQGEFDAMNDQGLANKYEENLTNLINDIREMAEDDSMPAIIPMISGSMWQYKSIVQAAEAAVAEKLVNADTMKTEGLAFSNDNVHYNAASMKKIGTVCGEKWLAMEYTKDWWNPVPVVYQNRSSVSASFSLNRTVYDLSGRMVGTRIPSQVSGTFQGHKAVQMFVVTSGSRQNVKVMNLENK